MKMFDKSGRVIEGACQFQYRGYTISCTTISCTNEISVINPDGMLDETSFAPNTDGLKMAMTYIDYLVCADLAKRP